MVLRRAGLSSKNGWADEYDRVYLYYPINEVTTLLPVSYTHLDVYKRQVLANGSLSSQSGGEGDIRKNIINAYLVDCIVAMPSQLFYTTQIPVSLWFLAKNKRQKGKTLFLSLIHI